MVIQLRKKLSSKSGEGTLVIEAGHLLALATRGLVAVRGTGEATTASTTSTASAASATTTVSTTVSTALLTALAALVALVVGNEGGGGDLDPLGSLALPGLGLLDFLLLLLGEVDLLLALENLSGLPLGVLSASLVGLAGSGEGGLGDLGLLVLGQGDLLGLEELLLSGDPLGDDLSLAFSGGGLSLSGGSGLTVLLGLALLSPTSTSVSTLLVTLVGSGGTTAIELALGAISTATAASTAVPPGAIVVDGGGSVLATGGGSLTFGLGYLRAKEGGKFDFQQLH